MKTYCKLLIALLFTVSTAAGALAAGEHGGQEHGGKAEAQGQEHGGKTHAQEHGGKEHGGTTAVKPSNLDIRNAMKNYVMDQSKATGTFDIKDPDTGKTLNLNLDRVHERVGKTGEYYYSCADFSDVNTGMKYDLDLDVEDQGAGQLTVADVRIHKENSIARYTYDDNDNRIPLVKGTESHIGKGGPKGEGIVKGSPEKVPLNEHAGKEHGGKEHGGK